MLYTFFDCINSHAITTVMNAKWLVPPVYIEIAEFLALENKNLYWEYVESVVKLPIPLANIENERSRYKSALEVASTFLTSSQINILKLALSLYSLTPLIESQFEISKKALAASKCKSKTFIEMDDHFICNISDLLDLKLEKSRNHSVSTPNIYDFDHVYLEKKNDVNYFIILYGDIGTAEFSHWFNIIKRKITNTQNAEIVVRNYVGNLGNKRVRLSGYGVELHLKSTEYKSQDDFQKADLENNVLYTDDLLNQDVVGISFGKLR